MGIELAELGKHKDACSIFDRILKQRGKNVNVIYAKSRSQAALGNTEESLSLLKHAISGNKKTIRSWAKQEKIFDSLKNDKRFRKLVD